MMHGAHLIVLSNHSEAGLEPAAAVVVVVAVRNSSKFSGLTLLAVKWVTQLLGAIKG
jgi:hypothetical protein